MLKADDFRIDSKEISGWKVKVTSYKIGEMYYCHIDNVDPGAIISRSEATTQEGAIQIAVTKAQERLNSKFR